MLKRHFFSNFIHATNTTLKYPGWGVGFFVVVFLFCFVPLITKKRKVQATEPANAEPANDAKMKHTVPVIVFLYIT